MTTVFRGLWLLLIVLPLASFILAADESKDRPIPQFGPNEVPQPARPLASGLKPDEAAAHISVPEGFQVTLAAGEPQVHQPIGFAMNEQGRLWVAEAERASGQSRDVGEKMFVSCRVPAIEELSCHCIGRAQTTSIGSSALLARPKQCRSTRDATPRSVKQWHVSREIDVLEQGHQA